MDERDGQLSTTQHPEHTPTPPKTVFSYLPAEILTLIYLHACTYSSPIILQPQLQPDYNIDLRYLSYNSDAPNYHTRCLHHALRHNTFTILPFNINQYASPSLSEVQKTFDQHALFFQHVRQLRLRLRSPLFEWPSRADALKQQERYSKWFLDCRFLHRFRALETLEFEHMVCLRDWTGGEGDREGGIEVWGADGALMEALRRAGIGTTRETQSESLSLSQSQPQTDAVGTAEGACLRKGVDTQPPEVRFVFDQITKFRAVDRHHVVWVRREMVRGFVGLVQEST